MKRVLLCGARDPQRPADVLAGPTITGAFPAVPMPYKFLSDGNRLRILKILFLPGDHPEAIGTALAEWLIASERQDTRHLI